MRDALQLPVAEVPREEEHALPAGERLADAIVALELDARANLVGRERAELEQRDEQPAEVRERRPRDRPALAADRIGNAARSCAIASRRWPRSTT